MGASGRFMASQGAGKHFNRPAPPCGRCSTLFNRARLTTSAVFTSIHLHLACWSRLFFLLRFVSLHSTAGSRCRAPFRSSPAGRIGLPNRTRFAGNRLRTARLISLRGRNPSLLTMDKRQSPSRPHTPRRQPCCSSGRSHSRETPIAS